MSDADLVRAYVRDQSQTAFAELVARHVDLVYATALRQLRSAALAEEVAQSVFLDLSRRASRLDTTQPLAPWLYVVTCHTAVDLIRRERRRQARETAAAEIAAMKISSASWSQIEHLVDEAMGTLGEAERTAVVLRFFKNLPLRDVGAALGVSDDAAQKRVSRALDQLRTFLVRRGVAGVTAAGLASELSAHALVSAPASLSPAIATATFSLSSAATSVPTLKATEALAMTTIQKSLIGAALALVVGVGLYEATVFVRQRSELTAQEQQAATLTAQLQRTRTQQNTATARLKTIEAQIDSRLASAPGDAALEATLQGWQANRDQLEQLLKTHPEFNIPELQLLTEADWFEASTGPLMDSDDARRKKLAGLRTKATALMGEKIRGGLNAYLKTSARTLPERIEQLLPYFDPPVDAAWLERYQMLQTGKLGEATGPAERINQSQIIGLKSYADIEYDDWMTFGPNGSAGGGNAMNENVYPARLAYARAHRAMPQTAAQLLPYLKWPASEAAVQRYLEQEKLITAARR